MNGKYDRMPSQKPAAVTDSSRKYVRFGNESTPDYNEPDVDYGIENGSEDTMSDTEPAADYDVPEADTIAASSTNSARPKYGVAVLPARPAGRLRNMLRSADTEHDLSTMENLNEVSILRVLEERFGHDVIQTYIGDVLIVINPYKHMNIYGKQQHEMYKFVNQRSDHEPHIYWTVDHAYRRMTDTATNQVILISGESGAGKTESTKLVVKHLTQICQSTMSNLHERIVKVNPLLEAFGNAQTVMNYNSSRFGKFVELNFDTNGHMKGACIHDYLLEKSRVVHLGPRERNFHVFYYMFAGMPEETLRYYYLEDPMAHRILKSDHNQKGVFRSEQDRDTCKEKFQEMEDIMGKVAFTKDDIATIYTCLAAILFITNIEFQPDEDEDGVVVIDDYPVNIVADLLMIDAQKLTTSLLSRTNIVNDEDIIALKTMDQANDERDAVAKSLYSRLFGWIVRQVNANLVDNSQGRAGSSNSIGILDLSGFENFRDNSFEQLCINVANEKLQYFFNTFIFATEQAIYEEEGIDWSHIEFRNNEEILRLFLGDDDSRSPGQTKLSFRKPPNMFTILDDESKSPRATDSTLILNWRKNIGDHPNFKLMNGDDLAFVITHFADEVVYNADNFLEKNRDRLGANLLSLLQRSENDFIKDLFAAELADTGVLSRTKSKIRSASTRFAFGNNVKRSGRGSISGETLRNLKKRGKHQMPGSTVQKVQTTASQYFKKSLEELMKKMNSAQPLFVRCIKPNLNQEPDCFSDKLVQRQLQYSGVLQIAKIARLGYPVRMTFGNFNKRFALIFKERGVPPSGDRCRKALREISINDEKFAIGNTKIFMKEDLADQLRVRTRERAALSALRAIRGFMQRKRYHTMKKEEEDRKRREIEEQERQKVRERELQESEKNKMDAEKKKRLAATQAHERIATIETTHTELRQNPDGLPDIPEEDDCQSLTPRGSDVGRQKGSQTPPKEDGSIQEEDNNVEGFIPEIHSESDSDDELEDMSWDIAQLVPIDRISPSEVFDGFVKGMRVLFYIFLFVVVLASGVCSILSLLWLERRALKDEYNEDGDYPVVYLHRLLWIIWIPYLWSFVTSVMKTVFGHMLWPPARLFAVVMAIETLHSFGVAILVFGVLPKVPTLYAIGLLCCVATVPAFLQIIIPRTHQTSTSVVMVKWAVSLLALVVQLGVVGYIFFQPQKGVVGEWNHLTWQLPASLVLLSLKWWENYVPRPKKHSSSKLMSSRMFRFKHRLHQCRTKLNTVMSLWNIVFTLGTLWLIEWLETDTVVWNVFSTSRPSLQNDTSENYTDVNTTVPMPSTNTIITFETGVFLAQITSSWTCYYFSALACKLLMHRLSFCAPLALSFPVAAGVVHFLCTYEDYMKWLFDDNVFNYELNICEATYKTGMGIAWWLSMLWICSHIWYPRSERLAKIEKLFVTRLFTGPLVVQSMLLNRRIDDSEVKEMIQLLKSVFRMDIDQSARRLARSVFKHDDPDYYDFETHVFFDDAMEFTDNGDRVVNAFVKMLVECMDEAASSVMEAQMAMEQPVLTPTPYGGRLTWTLPGKTIFVAHLKDKLKIRHLKRWSQVMYMYYLLGYKLFGEKEGEMIKKMSKLTVSIQELRQRANELGHFGKSAIFQDMNDDLLNQAENTYILALDGDVDFKPEAVRLLVDRMRKNHKTGAACGRIHPIGTGPMVWYQVFEYAVGHWFQKSTEHVLGCVLCSPGCFSLFRGSALLDDNVMKRYTAKPNEAIHFLQYDQGEDRWLCTLLLQQGYRVDYTAASDALTYAPEGFNEFFNQRRRWTPSTMANIIDLLSSASNTVRMNDNISWFYMFYQAGLMAATVLGPATVMLAIATAFETVLKIHKWEGYLMSLMPIVFQLIISFTTRKNTQLLVCAFLSTLYACVMTVVAVGILKGLVSDGFLDPSLIFLTVMAASFILAAMMHPYEFTCLLYGPIYFLCIPAGYLVLIIFALSNMQDISWGTRDVPKKKTKAEQEEEEKREEEKEKRKKQGWFSFINFDAFFREMRETSSSFFADKKDDKTNEAILDTLRQIRKDMKKINKRLSSGEVTADTDSEDERARHGKEEEQPPQQEEVAVVEPEEDVEEPSPTLMPFEEEDTNNPAWIRGWEGETVVEYLDTGETLFWQQLIKKYLKPVIKDPVMNDPKYKKKMEEDLIELRNNVSFAYWLINGLWILFNFMIQSTEGLRETEIMGQKTQPLGFVFMILFMLALALQFVGMMMHRWGTFLQLVAITQLSSPFRKKNASVNAGDQANLTVQERVQVMADLQKGLSKYDDRDDPEVDYSDDGDDEMMTPTLPTNSGASGGDWQEQSMGNGNIRRRHPTRLVDLDLAKAIQTRITMREKLQNEIQTDEDDEDASDNQMSKRAGRKSRPHTISRAMTRHRTRHGVGRDAGRNKLTVIGKYRRHGEDPDSRDVGSQERPRRRNDRSPSKGRGDERSPHRHRHHGRHRRHRQRRRNDLGPNTHVIRGGELEQRLIQRVNRWTDGVEDDTRL